MYLYIQYNVLAATDLLQIYEQTQVSIKYSKTLYKQEILEIKKKQEIKTKVPVTSCIFALLSHTVIIRR